MKPLTGIDNPVVTQQSLSKNNAVSKSENDIKMKVDSLSLNSAGPFVEPSNNTVSASVNDITTAVKTTVTATTTTTTTTVSTVVTAAADQVSGWEDIDAADADDELMCAEYAHEIFKYYRARESTFAVGDYLRTKQTVVNRHMRLLLVDWMVEVQQQLEFNHEVLYLSVKLLDLYLNRQRIEKEKLQLLGGAAMFIACKFEVRFLSIDRFCFFLVKTPTQK